MPNHARLCTSDDSHHIMLLSTITAKMPNFGANRPYSEQHTLDTQRRFDKKKTDTNQNVLVAKLEQQQFDGKAAQQAPQQTKRINKFNTLIRLKVRILFVLRYR